MANNDNNKKSRVFAPYNFVQLSDTIIQYPKENRDGRGQISDELLSGHIDYTISARTPIMVNKGFKNGRSEGFYQDLKTRKYAIPGSAVRGLIKSNAQILGMADVSEDIDNYRLMFREIAIGKDRSLYNEIVGSSQENEGGYIKSYVKNVKAGYITKEKGTYYIYPTEVDRLDNKHGEMNYYTLSEKSVLDNKKDYPVLFPNGVYILQNKVIKPKGQKSVENRDYFPYIMEVSYNVSADNRIVGLDKPGKLSKHGFAVSTGKMGGKRVLYIIPEIKEGATPIQVTTKALNAYRVDFRRKENGLGKTKGNHPAQKSPRNFFALPRDNSKKPVFYIQYEGELYFGFTPRLRLFTKYRIHDGIKVKRRDGHIDMAQSIFGYTSKESSYKSKVSFSNAIVTSDAIEMGEVNAVLAEPKPTFYAAYLNPKDGRPSSYNEKTGIEIRGVKQYWIKDETDKTGVGDNKKVGSSFKPLPEGTTFKGRVYFDNMRREELGLLLWAINLNGNNSMNIGYAKAYGYGAIGVKVDDIIVIDKEKAYSVQSFNHSPIKHIKADDLIEEYKRYASEQIGKNIDECGNVKDFFIMKDSELRPSQEEMRYMRLDKDYRGDVRSKSFLPKPEDIVKNKG